MRRLLFVVLAAFLLLAAPAAAADELPWAGGVAVETQTELRLAQAATEIAGRPVRIRCEGETDWAVLMQQASTSGLAGYVWFVGGSPLDFMELSPGTCSTLDSFLRTPPAEQCVVGTTTVARTVATPVVAGKAKAPRTRIAASTKAPVYGACPQSSDVVYAVWTLAHESIHLGGMRDEATADCRSLQLLERTATRLGAGARAAKELALYAADWYARSWQSGKPGYWSPECRDGGALDLNPQLAAWPS
jgi:hypothetical protein